MKSQSTPFPWKFILLTFAFSWLLWIPTALAANGVTLPSRLTNFLNSPVNPAAFGPTLVALLLTLFEDGWKGLGRLLKRAVDFRFKKAWLLPIFLLPPLVFIGATVLASAIQNTALDTSNFADPPMVVIAFVMILLTAGPLQEEFGWRGYALPRLLPRFSALNAGILLGIVWWLWHLPLVFIPGRFMAGTLPLFGLLLPEIVLMSILFTWIYNNTGGSLLAALLFHTTMNWSIWVLLPSMQVTAWIIGLSIVLLLIVVGIVLWRWGAKHLAAS